MRFSELGRPADALAPTEEAVAIRRELAVANPERYRRDLSNSLLVLASVLAASGRDEQATVARAEAETLRALRQ